MLSKYRKIVDSKKAEKDFIKKELDSLSGKLSKTEKTLSQKRKALLFIEEVAISTQKELSGVLEECVTAGLNSVFEVPYGFKVDFKINRGRPECKMYFSKRGRLVDPLVFSGLGAADVAAFSARTSCLSMATRYRRVLLLDEPFQRLKGEKENKRVIDLMRELSHRLKIQIICVNDERAARDDIIEGADRVFHVTQKNRRSQVEVLR